VSKRWLKAHYELVLRTYWRWLSTASRRREEDVHLMPPFFKGRRHYIQVDSRVALALESGVFNERRDKQQDTASQRFCGLNWKYALELWPQRVGRAVVSAGTVSTDRVTVNPHFEPTDARGAAGRQDARYQRKGSRRGGLHGSGTQGPRRKQSEG
jgi:hypothetical protein